ncbi:MAG: HAMP domain-containing sensor histidine kinase [Solirubrobacteraceae bacterium]
MTPSQPAEPAHRRTVRLRLTLLYGALFLTSGAALLALTYVLVRESTGAVLVRATRTQPAGVERDTAPLREQLPRELDELGREMPARAAQQRAETMEQLLVQSGTALGLMALLSVGLGWVMAGRVLRPLRTMTATTRRISEHNLHERLALEGPRDELKDLGDTIDGLLERLEAAFDAQRRFVANASHELRTPLAMMRTSLDVATAKAERTPPQLRVLDGKLREGLDRADRLLESFLALARAEHAVPPQDTSVSLPAIVSEAIAHRADAIAERGLDVRQQLHDAAAHGSHPLLARMVENVIDNAIRHNEPWGWVGVETRTEDGSACFVVESGGPRLQERDVQELAQPFRRLGAERTGSENGVGLGLSIVAAIAAAHDGELALHARPQGGLRVAIALPCAPTGEPA